MKRPVLYDGVTIETSGVGDRGLTAPLEAPILLLEPHFDDAALSCAALLDRQAPLDVLTVFAGDPESPRRGSWDELAGFPTRRPRSRRGGRSASAFAGSPHRVRAPARRAAVSRRPAARLRPRAIGREVTEWAAQNPGGLVALPAGAAGALRASSDGWPPRRPRRGAAPPCAPARPRCGARRALGRVGAAALRRASVPPRRPGGWGRRAAARRAGRVVVELVEPVDRVRKAARIARYASQLPLISPDGRQLDDPAALPPVERYWLLEPHRSHTKPPAPGT